MSEFFVYTHSRPDGSVFYVGKGTRARAYDFAASRRTAWHQHVVKKHGRENIKVEITPCSSEAEAFELERLRIRQAKEGGLNLVNLTDGGEGAAGRAPTEKQIAALERGRKVGKRGVSGPRPQLQKWIDSPEGKAHVARLGQANKGRVPERRTLVCQECHEEFQAAAHNARCCSRKCEQRFRRAGKNVCLT